MAETERLKIAITPGDINGVGPEIILKTFADPRVLQDITPIIYGSTRVYNHYRDSTEAGSLQINPIRFASQATAGQLNLVQAGEQELSPEPGAVTDAAGKFALNCLEAAVSDVKGGHVHALVTAPLNKENVSRNSPGFSGHTSWLAEQSGAERPLMILMNGTLRVALATEHIPLARVAAEITAPLVEQKIRSFMHSLKNDFGIRKPRVAVLGLNPHAGDNGLTGTEEKEILMPLLEMLRTKDNLVVGGPYGADGFFGSGRYNGFDGVLALYHDQGLGPFKALSFGEGVNFTAGLPFVRTSPDHGTAYDIAGKGIAGETSFRQALYTACDIYRSRARETELRKNPLKTTELSREK